MSFLKNIFGSSENESKDSGINWRELTDLGQLNEIINESSQQPVIVFKHSTRCIVSRSVLKQFEKEYNLEGKVIPYFLDLLNHRDVSNAIAERFEVTHQSPQLILIVNGKPIYHASHDAILVADVATYLE